MGLRQADDLSEDQLRELHSLYQNEWWCRGRTLEETRRVVEGSDLCFAFVDEETGRLAGFARVLTDFTFKAFLFDVIVAPEYRGSGLGAALIDAVTGHPALRGVQHLELYCLPELVPFYRRWGFTEDLGEIRLMRRSREEEIRA